MHNRAVGKPVMTVDASACAIRNGCSAVSAIPAHCGLRGGGRNGDRAFDPHSSALRDFGSENGDDWTLAANTTLAEAESGGAQITACLMSCALAPQHIATR